MSDPLYLDQETAARLAHEKFQQAERETTEKIRWLIREELINVLFEGKPLLERWSNELRKQRVERDKLSQSPTHDHLSVSSGVSESRRVESGSGRRYGDHDGGRGVHPGGCESEHRMLVGGAPGPVIDPESTGVPWWHGKEINLSLEGEWADESTITPDMIVRLQMPVEDWAAIVLEHMHEGFATSARGQAAQRAHEWIARELDRLVPEWRERVWPSKPKSSR